MITSFDQLMSNLRQQPGRTIAVAVAEKEPVLEAVRDACIKNAAQDMKTCYSCKQ